MLDPALRELLKNQVEHGYVPAYERRGFFEVAEVHARLGVEPAEFGGDLVKMDSQRYALFAKSCKCVACGVEGIVYAKEKSAKRSKATGQYRTINTEWWHLNLYALNDNGELVLMTKDHITPRSKGGADHADNYQTMCSPCNTRKSNRPIGQSPEEFARLAEETRRGAQSKRAKAAHKARVHAMSEEARRADNSARSLGARA